MELHKNYRPNSFRALESLLTKIIVGIGIVFAMMLAAGGNGVLWLKIVLAIPVLAASAMGGALLVMNGEYKRRRSRWMLAAFVSYFAVTVASLILGYPA